MPYKILIVEQTPTIVEGYRRILPKRMGFLVSRMPSEFRQALRTMQEASPHLLVINVTTIPNGLQLIERFRQQRKHLRILAIAESTPNVIAHRCFKHGAHGFLPWNHTPRRLREAIAVIRSGGMYFDEADVSQNSCPKLSSSLSGQLSSMNCLTSRELEILSLVGAGSSSKEIAHVLCLSVSTVEKYRSSVRKKLQINSLYDFIRAAESLHQPVEKHQVSGDAGGMD